MYFASKRNASKYVDDYHQALDSGKAKCFVSGKLGTPIPWRGVSESGVDGWWVRLCIEEVTEVTHTYYSVRACTWPDGAIKDPRIEPVIEEVSHITWCF